MDVSKITVNVRAEFLCEYEDTAVFALYLNGKFTNLLEVEL